MEEMGTAIGIQMAADTIMEQMVVRDIFIRMAVDTFMVRMVVMGMFIQMVADNITEQTEVMDINIRMVVDLLMGLAEIVIHIIHTIRMMITKVMMTTMIAIQIGY